MYEKLTEIIKLAAIAVGSLFFIGQATAQCIQDPDGRTAVILNNETSYVLTFFIDDMDRGAVPVSAKSSEVEIIAGEHLFGARATIQGQSFWVLVVNDVAKGELCTWTVLDPPDERQPAALVTGRQAGFASNSFLRPNDQDRARSVVNYPGRD
jgi:hypothetical protein